MSLLDLVFPKTCLECGSLGSYICDSCLTKVHQIGWFKPDSYAVWEYAGVIRKAIIALKYKFSLEVASELANRVVSKIDFSSLDNGEILLVPVSLHWKKKNMRGFNQVEEIGKLIVKEKGWKFIPDLIIKVKETKSQVELRGKNRTNNLSDSFDVNNKYEFKELIRKKVIILDDVFTTGSTTNEIKKILKNAGFVDIQILTISR